MPTSVELSTWIGVGPCGHPISFSVVRICMASWALINMVPHSASAADAIMLRIILHTTCMIPLMVGTKVDGSFGFDGASLRKCIPLALLLDLETERYDPSLWIANCMSLALYLIRASGLVAR